MDSSKILNISDFIKEFDYEAPTSMTFAIINRPLSEVVHYQSTNKEWERFYFNSHDRKYCHIMRTGVALSKNLKSFSVVWDCLPPDNEQSIYLNEKRIDLNHTNGISFCEKIDEDYLFCALLTGHKDDEGFIQRLIAKKRQALEALFQQNSEFIESVKFVRGK